MNVGVLLIDELGYLNLRPEQSNIFFKLMEQWWTHCGDAARYLGRAGRKELLDLGAEAIAAIQDATGLDNGPEWEKFFSDLDADGSPTAYIFRCKKCGIVGGYQDCD
jgi:uncharacterized protein CbrC (UPF0167 family)